MPEAEPHGPAAHLSLLKTEVRKEIDIRCSIITRAVPRPRWVRREFVRGRPGRARAQVLYSPSWAARQMGICDRRTAGPRPFPGSMPLRAASLKREIELVAE